MWLDVLTKNEEEETAEVTKLKDAVGELEINEQKLKLEGSRPDTLLFVGNAPQAMGDEELREFFKGHGEIQRAFVSFPSGHSERLFFTASRPCLT